jgi:hypothetical protein
MDRKELDRRLKIIETTDIGRMYDEYSWEELEEVITAIEIKENTLYDKIAIMRHGIDVYPGLRKRYPEVFSSPQP